MKKKTVIVIGGALADITGIPNKILIQGDSNPGKISISSGGVARNIAENLVRLDVNVNFITALGKDIFGNNIMSDCQNLNIDIKDSIIHDELPTAFYLLIVNEKGNLDVGISDTQIIKEINVDYIQTKKNIISQYDIIVLDTNLNVETIKYIVEAFPDKKIFIDLVSIAKALKIKDFIGKFHTIKPNLTESEAITGIKYENETDLIKMKNWFLSKGIKQIFISLGEKGCYFANEKESGLVKGKTVDSINASGAGDAFMSGIIASEVEERSIYESACFATGSAVAALSHTKAVNPNISQKLIFQIIKKYNIC